MQETDSDSDGNSEPKTWIFQANPEKYRIMDSLRVEDEEYWNLNQNSNNVRRGDRVLLWVSGANAGIYAVGTVVSDPSIMPDSPTGQTYWVRQEEGRRPKPRVQVRYDRLLLERPLSKEFLQADPDLWNLSILRSPMGTNFPVTQREWIYLRNYLEDVSES